MNTFNRSEKINVVAIVVTYNRKTMLIECINAIINQTMRCDIIVVDNASTDGTKDIFLHSNFMGDRQGRIHYLRLEENTGGAGGFYNGLKYAMTQTWKWFWLMDDDAKPEPDALKNLLSKANDHQTIYGSVAVGLENEKKRLCWPVNRSGKGKKITIEWYHDLKDMEKVSSIPFLGFFIHNDMVRKIGLPSKNFYIYGDDVEYCLRAKLYGAKIFIVKNSVISHPVIKSEMYTLANLKIAYRGFSPFKSYYEIRNKILIAKKYYGFRLWTQTLPGILFRALLSITKEKMPIHILITYSKAIADGLSGTSGKAIFPPE